MVAALHVADEGQAFLTELGHAEDVRTPELVGLGPADQRLDLLGGVAVLVEQEPASVVPSLTDLGPFTRVGLNTVSEQIAKLFDVGAERDDFPATCYLLLATCNISARARLDSSGVAADFSGLVRGFPGVLRRGYGVVVRRIREPGRLRSVKTLMSGQGG